MMRSRRIKEGQSKIHKDSKHISLEDAEAWSVSTWELEIENPTCYKSGDLEFLKWSPATLGWLCIAQAVPRLAMMAVKTAWDSLSRSPRPSRVARLTLFVERIPSSGRHHQLF